MSTESSRELDAAASYWIAKRDAGGWSGEDEAAFKQWLNESDRRQIAWLRLQRVWDETRRLSALGAGVSPGDIPEPGQWVLTPFYDSATRPQSQGALEMLEATDGTAQLQRKISGPGRRALWATAATLVLATVWYLFNAAPLQGHRYSTPVGGMSSLPLADGSKITLNTASRIRVDLTAAERRAELEQGEAFFDIAKDPHRPFVVTAGDKRVVVLGTKFSVRRDADDIRVAVTEGAVQVETPGSSGGAKAERLVAGTVAHTGKAGTLVQKKPLSEVEEELSWRGGVLIFRDTTLADAIAEFNRYTERQIAIVDPRVAGMRVAGSFQSSNAEDFVRLLEQGYSVRVEPRGDTILLHAR